MDKCLNEEIYKVATFFLPDPFGTQKSKTKSQKVLLVLPIREGNFQITADVGLLYLGSLLQNFGFKVMLLDCPKEQFSFDDFKTFVQEGDFDVVGFRCYSRDHNYVDHHAAIVKRIKPGTLTLVG